MTLLAATLQRYFTDYAHTQRDLSGNTIAAYRDTWRLLIKYAATARGVHADKIDMSLLDADLVAGFLDHLQAGRGNSAATRNARLTAIRAVLAYALPDHPEHAHTITRVLAIPPKRSPAPALSSSLTRRPTPCSPLPTRTRGPGDATGPCSPSPPRPGCGSARSPN